MPTVFGYHDVKDKDHWLASPRREEFFGPLGVTNIRTFVDPQNPTRVGVLMDVSDMDAVMAAMETEAAAEAMAYDGVIPETLVILVEACPTGGAGPGDGRRQYVARGTFRTLAHPALASLGQTKLEAGLLDRFNRS